MINKPEGVANMTLTIDLPSDVEAQLKSRANAAGQEVGAYAVHLLKRGMKRHRSIREISGEIGERFEASGETDDQLGEELERAKHEMREERHRAGQK
jgi:hypothetical protein